MSSIPQRYDPQGTPRAGIVRTTGAHESVMLIASSTGGPSSLLALFAALPAGLRAPILMVQHLPPGFAARLATRLNRLGVMPVREAVDGERIPPGTGLVAPFGTHMEIDHHGPIMLCETEMVHGVRPSADRLFVTAAASFGARCVGAVLSGMGRDGAEGSRAVRQAGGFVVGESMDSCEVYGMPRAAKELGGIDIEAPIQGIAPLILDQIQRRSLPLAS